MEDKEEILWKHGYKVHFDYDFKCVYISLPIYGEEDALPETCDLEDFEQWLDEKELREARAIALERRVLDGVPLDIAYQEEVIERCWKKHSDEIDERVEEWDKTETVIRNVQGYEVRLYTSISEVESYITYYVEMEIPLELYEKLSADEIIDLFQEMLEEMNYPDLGLPEFI